MTDAEFYDWLYDGSRLDKKAFLAVLQLYDEALGINKVYWLSSKPMVGDRAGIGGLIPFEDWILSEPEIENALGSVDYTVKIDFAMPDGFDLSSVQTASSKRIFVTLVDTEWGQDFIVKIGYSDGRSARCAIFDGEINNISKTGVNQYSILATSDATTGIRKALGETETINGALYNIPVSLGYCYNITPEIVSSGSANAIRYKYNHSALGAAVSSSPEVYEGGKVVSSNVVRSQKNATFDINYYRPSRLITSTVTMTDSNTVGTMISGFTGSNNLTTAQKNKTVGLYIPSSADITYEQVAKMCASSVHAYITCSVTESTSFPVISAVCLSESNTGAIELTDDEIISGSVKIARTINGKRKVSIKYKKNNTPLDASKLDPTLPIAYSENLAKQYSIIEADTGYNGSYEGADENIAIETLLYNDSDAQEELNYWAARLSKNRIVYSMQVNMIAYKLKIGDRVKVTTAEVNGVFYGNVVRRILNSDGLISTIEVLT